MRKAFICPTKYVQGEDELLNLGYFRRASEPLALNRASRRCQKSEKQIRRNRGKVPD